MKKDFDCIKESRKWKASVQKEIAEKSTAEILAYFSTGSVDQPKRRAKSSRSRRSKVTV